METKVKKLYRSRKDKVIAGVCGGLGDYFEIDPLIFRILFLIVAFGGGFGILLYIVMALIIPNENNGSPGNSGDGKKDFAEEVKQNAEELVKEVKDSRNSGSIRNVIGIFIVALGVFLLVNNLFPARWMRWDLFWPAAFILFGIAIIIRRK